MKSVLIVDDDKVLCRILELQLELSGHWARSAFTGEEGLGVAKHWQPDLILLDINLPHQSGLEILPQIQQQLPGIRVIMMSACTGQELPINDLQAGGGVDFLAKPFDFAELLKVLASVKTKEVNSV